MRVVLPSARFGQQSDEKKTNGEGKGQVGEKTERDNGLLCVDGGRKREGKKRGVKRRNSLGPKVATRREADAGTKNSR